MKFLEKATGREFSESQMEAEYRRESSEKLTSLDYRSWRDRWFEPVKEEKAVEEGVHFLSGMDKPSPCGVSTDMKRFSPEWELVTCLGCLKSKPSAPIDDAALVEDLKLYFGSKGWLLYESLMKSVLACLREKGLLIDKAAKCDDNDQKLADKLDRYLDPFVSGGMTRRGIILTVISHLLSLGWTRPPPSRRRSEAWVSKDAPLAFASEEMLRTAWIASGSAMEFPDWRKTYYVRKVIEWVDG